MTNSGANAHFWGIKMCPRCYEEYCKVGTSLETTEGCFHIKHK